MPGTRTRSLEATSLFGFIVSDGEENVLKRRPQDELRKQQNNEALRRQFADKANQVGPWIERQMDAVAAIGLGMQVR